MDNLKLFVTVCLLIPCAIHGQTSYNYRYWFDSDTSAEIIGEMPSNCIHEDIPLTNLSDGFHLIHLQVLDSEGNWSVPTSRPFIIMPHTEFNTPSNIIGGKFRYWFDGDMNTIRQERLDSNIIHLAIPVNGFKDWMHQIHFQVQDLDGNWSPARTQSFAIVPQGVESKNFDLVGGKYRYWFDGNLSTQQTGTITAPIWSMDIPVSELSSWLHLIHFQIRDVGNNWSPTKTQPFVIVPTKDEHDKRIVKFEYWLNGNTKNRHIVTLDENVESPNIIRLLPTETLPIRSINFDFSLVNGIPTIYAKNEITVIFYDASGYFTLESSEYVDENVCQQITAFEDLAENQSVSLNRPKKDQISWFKFNVEEGDSISFRLSQAATIQVFNPKGEEIYHADGGTSIAYGGCHVWEDGTCYLALHDVMGSNENMTLEYMHMDEYDVVDCNVHSVGNGGCSTITFKGNGFRDLYAVDLYTAEGDTIHSVDVSHGSDAETAVTFDFTNVKLESYDAVFHFTEEDRYFLKAITVEEPIDIELTTDVTYPSRFLRGNSTTYTIKITNKGNMTAYSVPVEMKLRTSLQDKISRIIIDGDIEHLQIPDNIVGDSLDEDIKVFIQELLIEKGDLPQFVFYDGSSDGMSYGVSQFIVTIPPSSTKQINVNIYGSWDVEFQCHLSKDWYPISISGSTNRKIKAAIKQETREWMCCQKERFECAADAITSVVSQITPPGWSCGVSVGNTVLQVVYDVWCSDGASLGEKIGNYIHSEGLSLANKIMSSVISCITANFRARKHALKEEANKALDKGDTQEFRRLANEFDKVVLEENSIVLKVYDGLSSLPIFNCIKLWTWGKPTCPPNPTSGGGRSLAVASFDPNDIYGYLSDAGSKFIADSVAKVNYTIEFENDTAFAQAAAHTVVIKDTLDSRYFDLNSFLPTAVKIGKREAFIDESEVMSGNRTKGFLKTIDMRPEIYAIAQVEGTYDMASGIAEWRFSSLDPMTMEPTDDLMQGILPVSYDGTSGIGEVMFEIGVKANKGDGAQIANRAGIVFDYEEAILTPTWVNTVDAVAPVSTIRGGIQTNDSTLTLRLTGSDNRSGVWKYNVYAQLGEGASWELVAENVTDTLCDVRIYEDIDYSFCVLATDSAGNVERKEFQPEFSLSSDLLGDANGDGSIDLTDAIMITYHSLGAAQPGLNLNAADVNRDGVVDLTDAIIVVYRSLGTENGGAGQGRGAEPE